MIVCQECGAEIPYDESYVKENCLYVVKDWKKCLCANCSQKWKESYDVSKRRDERIHCDIEFQYKV